MEIGNGENKKRRKKKLYINCVPFRSVLDNTLFFAPSVKRLPRATPSPPAISLTLYIYIIYTQSPLVLVRRNADRPSPQRSTLMPVNSPQTTTKIFSLNPIATHRHPISRIYIYVRFPRQGHVGSGMRVGRRWLPCSTFRRRPLMFCLALVHTHTRCNSGETVGTTNACVFLSITGALPFKQWPLDRLQMGVCALAYIYAPTTREQDTNKAHGEQTRSVSDESRCTAGECEWRLGALCIYVYIYYTYRACDEHVISIAAAAAYISLALCIYYKARGGGGEDRVTRDCLKISNDNGPRAKTDRCPVRTVEKRPVKTFAPHPNTVPQWRPFNLQTDRCQ